MSLPSNEEMQHIREGTFLAVPFTSETGIEIGRGPHKLFPHWIGVREKGDPDVPAGVTPDVSIDGFDAINDAFEDGTLSYAVMWGDVGVASWRMRELCSNLIRDGGHFVSIKGDGTLRVDRKTADGWDFVDPTPWMNLDRPTVCVVRYGAIGDAMQAASVLYELKKQGYHVTWLCEKKVHHVLKHDPRIDAFLVQDKGQVPERWLPEYWRVLSERFEKFVNLCEATEGSLLTIPGRANHRWPHELRHEMCNKNYLEFSAQLAELPFHPQHKFYPTDEERARAEARYASCREAVNADPYIVVWALSGSSCHKFYPHQDEVIARILLEIPEAVVYLTGDEACKILEVGWENEPRVRCTSGEGDIRDALALAQVADLVVGPETGTLNAVAFDGNAKIVLLSHSSAENLTKHWVNTESLEPVDTPCFPCHRLHYTTEFCHINDETGAALCATNISASRAWDAVKRAYDAKTVIRKLIGTK